MPCGEVRQPVFELGVVIEDLDHHRRPLGEHDELWVSQESDFIYRLFGRGRAVGVFERSVESPLRSWLRSEGVERFVQDLSKAGGTDEASFEAEFFRTVRPSSLLKRFETPEEVAALVVYVCSPRASATNGAALRVDGGVVRSIL